MFTARVSESLKADSSSEPGPEAAAELNEPARPAAARPVSHDAGGQAAGESAVRTERRQDRPKPTMCHGHGRGNGDSAYRPGRP
jgi:hypothetical protein